jgi:drug/metabolite transporter (DMT)-like permease
MLLGAIVLGEPVTWRLLVGLAGVLLSLLIVNGRAMREAWRSRTPETGCGT